MRRTAAIMQPTFLPWTGYFGLIAGVEDFVFLDDVQYVRRSWQSRNRVMGRNGVVTLTLPVAGKPSRPLILEARVAAEAKPEEILKSAAGCLGAAPHWPRAEGLLADALKQAPKGLAAVNISFIRAVSDLLGFAPRFHRSSELEVPPEEKSDRLLSICRKLGATRYLSPVGSADYITKANPFSECDVQLRFQNFTPVKYTQHKGSYESHMSTLDALAWMGAEALSAAIRENAGPAVKLDALFPREC